MTDFEENAHIGYCHPTPFNVSQGLLTGCHVCRRNDNLSRCGACKVVFYCGRDHQTADRPTHKSFCTKVRKKQAILDEEETILRNHPGDWMLPANPLENDEAIGHFWGMLDTRDYMRARYHLVEAQLKFNTRQAVETALTHMLDMLRLCRSDNMGVRSLVPALYLRLGRDQDCYDFCKWWETIGTKGDYDWGDTTLPYLDIKDADVFESVEAFTGRYLRLSNAIAVTLVKIRLLIDLQTLESAKRQVGPLVPREIFDMIHKDAVSSISRNLEVLDEDLAPRIKAVKAQVEQLYKAVDKANKHFWPAMLRPGNNLTLRPEAYSFGSRQEMQIELQYWYNAWLETPGAIGVIEELSK